ncbi:MAG: ABC transporter substrate-binding protein [Phycisphaerales bacterium]|nr:ABC transporter substrate-binding protein [Phycisphaerales bacterium]
MAPTTTDPNRIRIGYSPDPDDAFMWWPLLAVDDAPPAVDTAPFRFVAVTQDIETLNERSVRGDLEITAMSCAQYPHVASRYAITACGASMGDAYGPKLVARTPISADALAAGTPTIAIPGQRTSAFAALRLRLGPTRARFVALAFDRVMEAVVGGEVDAGVIIHEGQLTFRDAGLHLVEDLGAWWTARSGGPLPLGINTIRRDLDDRHGPGTIERLTAMLRRSVEHALAHREEGLRHALVHARGLSRDLADEFVGLYVNAWTLDFGPRGRAAVEAFLNAAADAGILPDPGPLSFIEPAAAGGG